MDRENPWRLLDVRDIQDRPRTQRERVLDDAIEALCALRDFDVSTTPEKNTPFLDGLRGDRDRTLDTAITVLVRMRNMDA